MKFLEWSNGKPGTPRIDFLTIESCSKYYFTLVVIFFHHISKSALVPRCPFSTMLSTFFFPLLMLYSFFFPLVGLPVVTHFIGSKSTYYNKWPPLEGGHRIFFVAYSITFRPKTPKKNILTPPGGSQVNILTFSLPLSTLPQGDIFPLYRRQNPDF